MVYFIRKSKLKKFTRFCCILSLLMLVTASLSYSQGVARIHGIDASDSCDVKIFVSVFNASLLLKEEPIMGYTPLKLDETAFKIYVDGKNVGDFSAKRFDASDDGSDMVLAIDVSGSVSLNYKFVRNAVKAYIQKRREGKDQIAILTFGTFVRQWKFDTGDGTYAAFTDDIDKLYGELDRNPTVDKDSTVLFKAIKDAVYIAAQGRLEGGERKVQKAVIVLSDGHNEGKGFKIDDCISTAKSNGIPIFSLAIPKRSRRMRSRRYKKMKKNEYYDVLEKISHETGGICIRVNNINELKPVYQKLDELLKKQYVLDFKLPVRISDGKEHILQIIATYKGNTIKSERYTFRTGSKSCEAVPMVTDKQLKEIKKLRRKLGWPERTFIEFMKSSFDTMKIAKLSKKEAEQLITELYGEIKNVEPEKGNPWSWLYIVAGLIVLLSFVIFILVFIRRLSLKKIK